MVKTSSSQKKKKRSKKSSKVQSRKISKTSNRKSKSKKLHRKESISDSSDDDSRTSFSVSSYSSEDEYRSKRARSRTRKDVKSGKKRVKRRSSSPEDSHRSRKKKGSKKDSGSRGRKRSKKKKKARRDASVSSTNSFDSSESEYEREKEREEGNTDKIDRYRWMDQPTLYDQRTENSNHLIEEKGTVENTSRRLRSVIIVIKQERERSESDNEEEHKEEIVCDHDDYPSCRSNDSNDGGSKKEPDHDSSFDSEKKAEVEVEKEDPCSEAHDPTGDPNGEDLETVLRRRALENLKKFRGKGSSESDPLERTLAVKIDPVQDKPPDEDRARADLARSLQSGENNSEGGEGVDHNVIKSPSEAIISKEPQEEAKEASQYEQKTMSVMRGGEMVQVSYSVYIPKKTPALARRQLKR